MKRIISMILAAVLCLALLSGCSAGGTSESTADTNADTAPASEAAENGNDDDQGAYPDDYDEEKDDVIDNDEGKTKGGDPIESINGKDDEAAEESNGGGSTESAEGSTAAEEPESVTVPTLPDLTIAPEDLQPDEDFAGSFSNDEYSALILKDGDQMKVVIRSLSEKSGYEWTMSGYFSDENYRIRYFDAVKAVISYSKDGAEEGRTTEYENGSGVIQFSDTSRFTWINNMEPIEKTEFVKSE